MTYAEFDESWGNHAEEERRTFDAISVADLVKRVRNRDLGEYYTIWPSLAARASLKEAGVVLYEFLRSDADYLFRYHCAEALLKLLGLHDLEAADLTVPHRHPEKGLARVRDELQTGLGISLE